MRLDEWQKYIDSQFLDEEPEPVPAPKAPKVIEEAAKSEPVAQKMTAQEAESEIVTQEALFSAVFSEEPDSAPFDSLDTAPIVIQNMVTMVVMPLPPPVQPPAGHMPRIEVLTPLPETPSESKPESKSILPASEEVTNRTRRRSHVAGSPLFPDTDSLSTPSDSPDHNRFSDPSSSDPSSSNIPTNNISTKTTSEPGSESHLPKSTDALVQSLPNQEAFPRTAGLFEPISDLDADIPVFQRYLPSSHAAAMPIETPATRGAQSPRTLLPEAAETRPDCIVATDSLAGDPTDEMCEEERDLSAASETDRVRRATKSRARHARNVRPANVPSGLSATELWAAVPRHVQTLLSLERLEEKEVAQFSYKRQFQEKRHELIERLLDPILSLEDTARLLNVCPTTVRRYTNKGILTYYRKEPERSLRNGSEMNGSETNAGETASSNEKETRQRRFRLSDILAFLETQQAAIESDRQAEHQAERRRLARAANTSAAPRLEPNTVSDAPPTGKDS